MRIAIIVAVAQNDIIGGDNTLLWHLPEDLKHFKNLTQGNPIIMGRKTFESLPGILPQRPHIVITRNKDWAADRTIPAHSLEDAIKEAEKITDETAFIIGGGEIYRQVLKHKLADILYVTEVHATPEGDTTFPQIDALEWAATSRDTRLADEKHQYDYAFVTYERRN